MVGAVRKVSIPGQISEQAKSRRSVSVVLSTQNRAGGHRSMAHPTVKSNSIMWWHNPSFCSVSEESPNLAGLSYIQTDIEDSPVVCTTRQAAIHGRMHDRYGAHAHERHHGISRYP